MLESRPVGPDAGHAVLRPERIYEGYVFDLDGTIYLGSELLPGASRLVAALRRLGKRILFVSNNPTRDPDAYASRLSGMGIPVEPSEVLNTVVTMTRWLAQHHPTATVFPIAEEPLKRALRGAGIRISEDPAEIDFVIASYDRTFDYRKLQIAFDALWYHRRARLVATNPDRFCPFPGGRGEPDAASVTAAVEACTGVRCEAVFGKPARGLLDMIAAATGLHPATTVMVGDRLSTDVRFAHNTGMIGALVLTGETDRAMLGRAPFADQPHVVLERLDELLTAPAFSRPVNAAPVPARPRRADPDGAS
jgi:HAD superfamily hydrolase (TIGR01450 family)